MINLLILVFIFLAIWTILEALKGAFKAKTWEDTLYNLMFIGAVVVVFVFRAKVRL
jgi:hypothetical protein